MREDIEIRKARPGEPGCWVCMDADWTKTNVVEMTHPKLAVIRQFNMCDVHLSELHAKIPLHFHTVYEPQNYRISPEDQTSLS